MLQSNAFAQARAGIKANGKVLGRGDTILTCINNAIVFEGANTSGNVSWIFQKGSPSGFNGNGPVNVSFASAGVDSVIQNVTSGNQKDSFYVFVKVSDKKPTPAFDFSPNSVCGNEPITFTNNTSTSGLNYNWDFKDGTTVNTKHATHQFLNAIGNSGTQTYNVSLTATDNYGCSDSLVKPVTVKKIPDAGIDNADPSVTFGNFNGVPTFRNCSILPSYNFKFKNSSTTTSINTEYTIDWGDGTPDTTFTSWPGSTILNHTYPIGNKTLTVTVKGSTGCIGIKKYNVFLGTNPAGGFSSLGNTSICSPDSLTFVITGYQNNPPGTTYKITVNDGTPVVTYSHPPPDSVSHLFNYTSCGINSSNGSQVYNNSFSAILDVGNPCGSTSISVIPIYVSGKPVPSITAPETVCKNANVTIYNTSNMGAVITPTGGTSSTCTSDGIQVWEISPSSGYTITGGSIGSLNGSHTNSFLWTSGSSFLTLNFSKAGTYTVKMWVANDRCGLDSTVTTICVREVPKASFGFGTNRICEQGNLTLNNTSSDGGCNGDKYYWTISYSDPLDCNTNTNTAYSFINNTSNVSKNPQLSLNKEGQYIFTLTTSELFDHYSCPASVAKDTFFVKGKPKVILDPVAQICVNNSIAPTGKVFSCYDSSALTYKWTFTNGVPGTSADSLPGNIAYNSVGVYPIKFAVTNTCGTVTAMDSVHVINVPVANAGADKEICSGDTVSIGVSTGTGLTYKWLPVTGLDNAASATPNLTLTYSGSSDDTTYQYIINVSAGVDCSTEDTVNIKVKKSPVIIVKPASADICVGSNVQLVATGASSYLWSPQGSLNTNNRDTVIANPATTTTYTVKGSVANGCSTSQNVTVTVHEDAVADFSASLTSGCTPFDLSKVITTNTYPDRNGNYEWYADGVSIGNTGDGSFPGYTLNSAGQAATIRLITTSNYGCKPDTIEQTFNSVPAAIAKFNPDKKSGCEPLAVQYKNTSNIISGVQFFWDFGNGTKSTDAQPAAVSYSSSVYGSDTTYYITLKAYNGCDTTTWKDTVIVYAKPKARFGVDSTFGCSPFSFQVNNSSYGNPSVYYWDYGNGDKDTLTGNATFTYTYNTGILDTFRLQMIAENACARDTQAYDIIVAPNVIKPFINVNGSDLYSCAPHLVTFNNNSTGATKFTWDFGDGSSPLITTNYVTVVTHTYNNPGTYDIHVDVTNGCSDTIINRQAVLYAPPVAAFTADNSLFCIYDTVYTVNQSQNTDAFRISWGDNTSISGNTTNHKYALPGTYDIKYYADRINNIGIVCSDTAVKVITVFDKPDTHLQTNIRSVNCAPFNLSASAPGITDETTNWTLTDSTTNAVVFSTSSKQLEYVLNKEGAYKLKLFSKNAAGCSDSSEQVFHVYYTPRSVFDPVSINTCTQDTVVTYTNNSSYAGSDVIQYKWLINNSVVSSVKDLSYRYSVSGNTSLPFTFNTWLISSNNAGCADTSKGSVTINPLAIAAFVVQNPNTCVPFNLSVQNQSKNAYTYRWLLNGDEITTNATPQVYITEPSKSYTLTLIAYNYSECKADTASYTFNSLAKPVAAFNVNDTLGCTGNLNIITTNLSQGATGYLWNWGDASAPATSFEPGHYYSNIGQYRLQLIADNGTCKDTALQLVGADTKPVANYTLSDTVNCGDITVKFINLSSGATQYLWDFGDGTTSTASDPGKNFIPSNTPYSVKLTATSRYGCKDSVTKPNIVLAKVPPQAGFIINPAPTINIPDYTFSFLNSTVYNTYYRYLWSLGDGTISNDRDVTHKYNDTGHYTVQLIVLDTLTNCTDTATQVAQIAGVPGYLFVPNAFQPGSIRESLRKFLPKGTGLKTYRLEIYTTWGQKIFETTSLDAAGAPNEGWDGSFNGKRLEQDVYTWKITATFQNGTEWPGMKYPYSNKYSRVGSVTVIR